jgi:hypothetical protein
LGTPRNVESITVSPGKFYHVGLKSNFKRILKNLNGRAPKEILISINVDGVEIFKDSKAYTFWLILGQTYNIPSDVFYYRLISRKK